MKLFITLLLIGSVIVSNAQNGKLVEKLPYSLPDSALVKQSRRCPELKKLVSEVETYRISYLSDGLRVKGYLIVPRKPGPYPVIIFNRGGNRELGKVGEALVGLMTEMAGWGYVVAASQYRGNDGGEGREEFGGAEVNDILNLLPLLNTVKEADTSRIGIMGWSRGGMMTFLTLSKSCRFKAAVVGAGMTDAFATIRERPEMETNVFSQLIPDYASNKDSELLKRSAVYWANNICRTTPLLIMHGTADWRVNPQESFKLVQKLYKYKHPVRYLLLEGGQHSLIEHWTEMMHNTRVFFDKYLRDREIWPSLEPHGD